MTDAHAQPDTVECPHCRSRAPLEHFRLGMRMRCPVCGREDVPKLVEYGRWWYDVTFPDFRRLVLDPDTRGRTLEYVSRWLGWALVEGEGEACFTDEAGRRHSLEAAHLLIQHHPDWRFDLYQMAMNFWR